MEKFTFFWYGPFSQWYLSPMVVDGIPYNCCEQYMMASKAILFNDLDTCQQIMDAEEPRIQKKLGRQVNNFDVKIWNSVAKEIVKKGNLAKFSQNTELKKLLLNTEGTLVEASPYDKIWGIGLGENDPKSLNRTTWEGTNWLGEILTEVREFFRRG